MLFPLDVVFRLEAYRFSIAARDGDDVRILILERLKQGFGGSPEPVDWSVMMRRNIDIRFVRAHVLQRALRLPSLTIAYLLYFVSELARHLLQRGIPEGVAPAAGRFRGALSAIRRTNGTLWPRPRNAAHPCDG